MDVASRYLADLLRAFRSYKKQGEAAIAQVPDADLHTLIDPDANSIAILVKHLAGNYRSRYIDFLTTDGEKPWRDRDVEFVVNEQTTRAEILEWWEAGWAIALGAIEALTVEDLEKNVQIRGETFVVLEALNRSLTHGAYHVGQITLLAKHFAGPNWTSLSIPKGQSKAYAVGTYKQAHIPRRPS